MVPVENLRRIYLLENLTDEMLEKIQPLAEIREYQNLEVIFREGEKAIYFNMLFQGKVLLEVQASESLMISLGAVKPGFSFGWSALLTDHSYTAHAICREPSEVIMIPGKKLLALMDEDHHMGYRIMEGVVHILKRRLERRTNQFLKTLRQHPDIKEPFWE
jgi:CRP-like cAMP-binding protein